MQGFSIFSYVAILNGKITKLVKETKYLICVFFILDISLYGYVYDITNVNLAKKENRIFYF